MTPDQIRFHRAHATGLRDVGRRYDALPYSNTANVLERIIGDKL